MLYPVTNAKRIAISLNGLWNFSYVCDSYLPLDPILSPRLMGVPGSFNDAVTSLDERDYSGKVCYEKQITLPESSDDFCWHLRLGAAPHRSEVYINGKLITSHNGGYLPIDCIINEPSGTPIRISIILDTRLDFQTLPMGELTTDSGVEIQTYHFDFYNYIGLHRNVFLYRVPVNGISDISIKTTIYPSYADVHFLVNTDAPIRNVRVIDPLGNVVAESSQTSGTLKVEHPILWDIGQGNLYTLSVQTSVDQYDETFGIRTIEVTNREIFLNGRPITLQGFGMHEDHTTLGKGSISVLNVRDFELLKWIGANSFRTSHYPYDEEMYRLADTYGILVINEMPAVGLNFWGPKQVFTAERVNHASIAVYCQQFDELWARDKNHPSIIMYSLANEANTHEVGSIDYFKSIFDHVRTKTDLPLMIVEYLAAEINQVAQWADVIGLNRYYGWYTDVGNLSVIEPQLKKAINDYIDKFNKPILLSEFGADTIAGLHSLPSVTFSEEYQNELIQNYITVASTIHGVIGTHVWNFADFQTKQGIHRINGNKKGVFTRDRQPKLVAHTLRSLWKTTK